MMADEYGGLPECDFSRWLYEQQGRTPFGRPPIASSAPRHVVVSVYALSASAERIARLKDRVRDQFADLNRRGIVLR